MTKACETPAPKSAHNPNAGYDINLVQTAPGYEVATYTWTPTCGLAASKGVVFLLHGIHSYTDFEWLTPNADNRRTELRGSVVEKLLDMDLTVIAHDHPGHGRSSGLRGYIESFDEMRDISIAIIQNFNEMDALADKPRFVFGNSMGGTIAVRVAEKEPDLVDGYVLISPAVQPPDDMLGAYGKFLTMVRPALSAFVPRLRVINLPASEIPEIRDAVEKDPMVTSEGLRVRMGVEFLRVYEEIFSNADKLKFNKVVIFIGGKDNLVSPDGIKQFVEKIQCDDKQMFSFDHLGHEVFREPGCDEVIGKALDWLKERL